jgi:transposase InsO family protein
MAAEGLRSRPRRRDRATTDSKPPRPVAPNTLARAFETTAPDRARVGDVTAVWTAEGWVDLAALLDLWSRRVVGWSLGEQTDTALALGALRAAVASRRPPRGLVLHTDRGSPYASEAYPSELSRHGRGQSMSRRGNCWDDAVAESFFSTRKTERVPAQGFATRAAARAAIRECIDDFYNLRRRRSRNGCVSPIEDELARQAARCAA